MEWIRPTLQGDFTPFVVVLTVCIQRVAGCFALGIAFASLWVGIRRRSLNWPGVILALLLVHPSWFIDSNRSSDFYGGLAFLALFASAAMGGALFCQVLFPSLSRRRFLHWLVASLLVFDIVDQPLSSLAFDFGYFERPHFGQTFVEMVLNVWPYAPMATVLLLAICLIRLLIECLWTSSQKRFPGKYTAWLEHEPNGSECLCIGFRCRAAIIFALIFLIGLASIIFWRIGAGYTEQFGIHVVFVFLILAVLRRLLPDL